MWKLAMALAPTICVVPMIVAAAAMDHLPRLNHGTVASADGVLIAYATAGKGDITLLFIHGGFADSTFWRNQIAAFADEHQVVTADMAGHGRSGRQRQQWTIAAFGEDVRAVVEALDLHSVVVIGNSMGGPIGLEAARILPDRIVAVIGVDALNDATAKIDGEARDAFIESVKADFPAACQGMMKALFHEDANPSLVEEVRQLMCEPRTPTPAAFLDAFDGYDRTAAFKAAKVPIRSLNGDLYPTNIEGNQELADYDAVVMHGVGHYPMLERPTEFNRLLAAMLKDLVESSLSSSLKCDKESALESLTARRSGTRVRVATCHVLDTSAQAPNIAPP